MADMAPQGDDSQFRKASLLREGRNTGLQEDSMKEALLEAFNSAHENLKHAIGSCKDPYTVLACIAATCATKEMSSVKRAAILNQLAGLQVCFEATPSTTDPAQIASLQLVTLHIRNSKPPCIDTLLAIAENDRYLMATRFFASNHLTKSFPDHEGVRRHILGDLSQGRFDSGGEMNLQRFSGTAITDKKEQADGLFPFFDCAIDEFKMGERPSGLQFLLNSLFPLVLRNSESVDEDLLTKAVKNQALPILARASALISLHEVNPRIVPKLGKFDPLSTIGDRWQSHARLDLTKHAPLD